MTDELNPYSMKSRYLRETNVYLTEQATDERLAQWFLGEPCDETPHAPLRAVHVGPCLRNGGAEHQIMDLQKFLNPGVIRLKKLIVTEQDSVDPLLSERLHVDIEIGGAETLRRASQEYDIVLFWGLALDKWLAESPPKLCVYMAHGDGAWTQAILDESLQVTDHVIAVSQRVRDTVCCGAPTTVILNGVDAARLAQSRSRRDTRTMLGFTDDDFLLGYVGRFSPEKQAHLLIETLRRLPSCYKGLFVGWGPLQAELLQMANNYIPNRYAFVDASEYLGDFYHAMDAFCLLSAQEGFALVMIEAMMCGRPVVATPVGAVPEVIRDGRNGLIVSDQPREIAKAVTELRELPAWARGLADVGREYAQQYGHARRMAREYENLLSRLWEEKFRAAV